MLQKSFGCILRGQKSATEHNGYGATGHRLTSDLPIPQTGLTLLLKKAYKLGKQARAVGRTPADGGGEEREGVAANGGAVDGAAAADANMAELLAELQAEARPE